MIILTTLAVLSLILILAPLMAAQFKQSRDLNQSSQARVDSVLLLTYLLEREHTRLREVLHETVENQTSDKLQALRLRYDIFISRFDLVKDSPVLGGLADVEEFRSTFTVLELFIKKANGVMSRPEGKPLSDALIQDLAKEAEKDAEVLRELTTFSSNSLYRTMDERNAKIANQGYWLLGLASLFWLILVASLVVLIGSVRKQRRHSLELVQAARLQRAASRKAETANQAKSVFLANMSHELRTPFQGLLGMLNLLADTPLSDAQQDYANTSLQSARHLLGILNDILDISTIESGSLKLRTAPLNVRSLISEVEALMLAAAKAKGLQLSVRVAGTLPVWVEADPTRLSQILFNLLSNAIKFTDSGLVLLQVIVSPVVYPGEQGGVRFIVNDSGIGMDAATLSGLFSRFYQADLTAQRRFGGSGLGLQISRNLARLMGGTITVTSTVDVGSVFTVDLPLPVAKEPKIMDAIVHAPQRSLRVLIAEDHPVNIKYLRILLEQMGHESVGCENGIEVLECLEKDDFDIILMDLHMPLLDGMSATRAIRNLQGPASTVKIIMLSADILNDTRHAALQAGVNEFLAKPVQADDLRKALQHCVYELLSSLDYERLDPLPRTDSAPTELVSTQVFQDFVDLMPAATVKQQLAALFGGKNNEVNDLAASLSSNDRADAGEKAHRLKGVCLLMGLTTIANTLAKIEAALLHPHIDFPSSLLAQLWTDVDDTRVVMASFQPMS
ncbi:MAG: response regulator [Burkholderiaceae bacterium]|nr:response regulator [Burkholderiaceae bacterium]